ncbi:MAG: septum site-determining protein MinC [Lachnospiraceae bacterium]|nr:septum site-determining protein MinC [Lachnospiraceae bacterium]
MTNRVTLKGVKSGIVIRLPEEGDFNELLPGIEDKFKNAAEFFGSKHLILSIEGRKVSEMEAAQILKLLAENTKVKCEGIVMENPELEEKFQSLLGPDPGHEKELAALKKEREQMTETIENLRAAVDPMNCRIVQGNLRSGANLESPGSILIIGDVKPGASVTAGGCIFVLGALQGNADAGAYGDPDAFIFAMEMDPIQVRISDAMAIAADNTSRHKKGIFAKKEIAPPEVALIDEGHIVITPLDSDLVRENRFCKKLKKNVNGKVAAGDAADNGRPTEDQRK